MFTVNDIEVALENEDVLIAAMRRACRYQHVNSVKLYPAPRRENGFMEWIMMVEFIEADKTSYTMTVGVVQRSKEADVEFHT